MFRRRSGISEQHPRHRTGLDGVSVRRRFTASSFRFWGSVTSGRLGRVTVLPQLKVDRVCSVVDGTADFDPNRTKRSTRPAKPADTFGAGVPLSYAVPLSSASPIEPAHSRRVRRGPLPWSGA